MRNISKTVIALTIAAAAVAIATPSFAQSKNWRSQESQSSTFVPDQVPRDRGASN